MRFRTAPQTRKCFTNFTYVHCDHSLYQNCSPTPKFQMPSSPWVLCLSAGFCSQICVVPPGSSHLLRNCNLFKSLRWLKSTTPKRENHRKNAPPPHSCRSPAPHLLIPLNFPIQPTLARPLPLFPTRVIKKLLKELSSQSSGGSQKGPVLCDTYEFL